MELAIAKYVQGEVKGHPYIRHHVTCRGGFALSLAVYNHYVMQRCTQLVRGFNAALHTTSEGFQCSAANSVFENCINIYCINYINFILYFKTNAWYVYINIMIANH